MSNRRQFTPLLGGATVTWPLAARAQQPNRIARIGYLSAESLPPSDRPSRGQRSISGMRCATSAMSRAENLHIEFRYADADLDQLPALAAELVGRNVDIIVTYSVGTFAARRVTATIPIVLKPLALISLQRASLGALLVRAGTSRDPPFSSRS